MSTLRAEKTTRNRDDFRVLMAGTVFAIFIMIFTPTIMQIWDHIVAPRPFVQASVEIKTSPTGVPFMMYDADAIEPVDGVWIASLVDQAGQQLMTRRGNGSYSDVVDFPRPWTWFAFFDNDKGLDSPEVPDVPFKVCVRYIVSARDSGVTDETPTYCSNLFDPRT